MVTRILTLSLLIYLAATTNGWTWGQSGHSIIAEIAQHQLDDRTFGEIEKLLGSKVSLASIANWADDYKASHKETEGWHFVNIPYDRKTYDPSTDCKKGDCAVDAITRFREVLADCSKSRPERVQALMFLVHLVGDIHQPLHTAYRMDFFESYSVESDIGGNRVKVKFFGESTNLHEVWDSGLIGRVAESWGGYVERLESSWLPNHDVSSLRGGTPADWAVEAHKYARDVAYDLPDDGTLGIQYFTKSVPVVDRQLAVAALRLAAVLTEAFKASCPNFK